ncbi:MAG: GNAT family N-acetyltransferase [Candidatus Hodarchaeales archaeon]
MNLQYNIATEKDIPELTKIMTRTFDDDSQKYLDEPKGGPDGYDNGEFYQRWMIEEEASTGYKIILNDKIIGAFIVFIYESGKNVLGTMFIDPQYQNLGIGTRTWQFIEDTYPNANAWALDTPSWATRNHHFYEKKCGFKKVSEEDYGGFPGKMFTYQKWFKETI